MERKSGTMRDFENCDLSELTRGQVERLADELSRCVIAMPKGRAQKTLRGFYLYVLRLVAAVEKCSREASAGGAKTAPAVLERFLSDAEWIIEESRRELLKTIPDNE